MEGRHRRPHIQRKSKNRQWAFPQNWRNFANTVISVRRILSKSLARARSVSSFVPRTGELPSPLSKPETPKEARARVEQLVESSQTRRFRIMISMYDPPIRSGARKLLLSTHLKTSGRSTQSLASNISTKKNQKVV